MVWKDSSNKDSTAHFLQYERDVQDEEGTYEPVVYEKRSYNKKKEETIVKKPETEKKYSEEETKSALRNNFKHIIKVLKDYVDLKEEYYPLIATWIIGTYLHDKFTTYPYLFINAMRGSGKTRLLKLIAALSHNGKLVTSVREAVLFRMAKDRTLCIDEFEGIARKENAGLRELLNAAYKKGITIERMRKVNKEDGEGYDVEEFEPYTPICIANIWGMEEVLGDRCVTIILEKSSNSSVTKKIEDYEDNPDIKLIKDRFSVVTCGVVPVKNLNRAWNEYIYTTTLTTIRSKTTSHYTEYFFPKIYECGIDGRNLELTLPLLTTTYFIGKPEFELLLPIMVGIMNERKTDEMSESRDVLIIDFVSRQNHNDWVQVKSLTGLFKAFVREDEKDEEENWINSKWVGRALKRLSLVIEKRRLAAGVEVRLNYQKATDKIRMFK